VTRGSKCAAYINMQRGKERGGNAMERELVPGTPYACAELSQ
jgi:hypothetical protein